MSQNNLFLCHICIEDFCFKLLGMPKRTKRLWTSGSVNNRRILNCSNKIMGPYKSMWPKGCAKGLMYKECSNTFHSFTSI